MRKLTFFITVLVLSTLTAFNYAQTPEKPRTGFTLTISGGEHSYYKGMYYIGGWPRSR